MQIDNLRFAIAYETAVNEARQGIGRLGEKTIHRTLKHYFEPDSSYHEVKYGPMVCDIKKDGEIIEIQTRSFDRLIPKLRSYLLSNSVTVVYPIIENKTIFRIDVNSGETISLRRSSKKGNFIDALAEIAKLREFIPNENLRILLVFIDATEARMDGKTVRVGRKRTEKLDAIPTSINSIIELDGVEDYRVLLPENLPNEFGSKDFEKLTKLHNINLHAALAFFLKMGFFNRDKRGGRCYIYTLNE